jgi:WD40 repeat protein
MSTGRDRLDFPKLPEDLDHLPDKAALLEFNEVVLKACHPQVKERYQSATDLLDDLLLLQAGRSVKRLRFVEKRLSQLVPAGLAVVGLAGALLLVQQVRTREAQKLARVESDYRHRAESQALANRQLLYAADMNLAHQAFRVGDLGRARNLLSGHIPKPGERDLRSFEWHYYWRLSQGDQIYTFPSQAKPIAALAFSPDGTQFASAGYDNQADLWDLASRRLVKTYRTSGPVEDVGFSPDGQQLLVSDETGSVEAKGISTDRTLFHLQGRFRHMAVSPVAPRLALGAGGKQFILDQGPAVVWDYQSNQQIFSLPEAGTYVAFSPDGRRLATGSWNHELKLWDMQNGKLLMRLGPIENNFGMSFSPDGQKLAVGDESGFLHLWNLESGKELRSVRAHAGNIFKTAVSADGKRLATVGTDQTIRLWDAENLSELDVLHGHASEVWGVAFSRDSRSLISSGKDGTIRLWNLERQARQDIPTKDVAFWHWPVFSDDGRLLAVGSKQSGVTLWTVANGDCAGTISAARRPLAFVTNAETLVAFGNHGDLQYWDLRATNPACVGGFQLGVADVFAHAFIQTRLLLITGDTQGDIRLWNTSSGTELDGWKTHSSRIVSMSVSPDHSALATVNENESQAKVWDLATHNLKATLSGHKLALYSVAFSPDGRLLATASVDDTSGLWDARTGTLVAFLGGHKGGTYSVAFSQDGKTLAVGCNEGELKLWNLETKRDMMTLQAEPHAVFSASFSPDGSTLATVSFNHQSQVCSLQLWHAEAP